MQIICTQKRVCEDFETKKLGKYHDLYVKSNTLLLVDVFLKYQSQKCWLKYMYLEIYGLDPAHFLSTPGLAWQATLKKTKVKLKLLGDIDMLLMIENGISGKTCHATYRYGKANNKCMKNYDTNKKSSHLKYQDVNSLYGWAMSENLLEIVLSRLKIHFNSMKI